MNSERIHLQKIAPESKEDPLERAQKLVTQIGLEWDKLSVNLKEMLGQMDALEYLDISEHINQLIEKLTEDPDFLSLYKELRTDRSNVENTIMLVMQGNVLSDIGKRGPRGVTKNQSDFILEIFKVRNVKDSDKISLGRFALANLIKYKTNREIIDVLNSLKPYDVTADMTLRAFYNLHTEWSLGILNREKDGVISQEVKNMVARHHTLDIGANPDEELTLEDKMVMLMDKYDAIRHRGYRTHEDAIASLRDKVQKSEFSKDREFETLLKVLDKVAPSVDAYK